MCTRYIKQNFNLMLSVPHGSTKYSVKTKQPSLKKCGRKPGTLKFCTLLLSYEETRRSSHTCAAAQLLRSLYAKMRKIRRTETVVIEEEVEEGICKLNT